jgi:hypothetical protein
MLREAKELFAAGAFAGTAAAPEVFRPLPEKRLKRKKALQKVRVTFRNPGLRCFELEFPAMLQSFWNAMGPNSSFMIEKVEIEHPSDFLELAVLVDTPGLDWIRKHHCEKIARSIMQGDVYLFFLNAKHILNQMDRDNYQEYFCSRQAGMEEDSIKECDRFFYVINFADALSISQRETVYNFVMNSLAKSADRTGGVKPKIFLISALQGLTGEESGVDVLLKNLEQTILTYRGRGFYLTKANELYASLDSATRKISSRCLDGQLSGEAKKNMRQAQEILRKSKRKLKDIRNIIFNAGRF